MAISQEMQAIKETLAPLEERGCRVVCADELNVVNAIEQAIARVGAILLLINMPEIERDGCNGSAIPCRTSLSVQAIELPALRNMRGQHPCRTVIDAAEEIARLLDGRDYNFVSIRQSSDPSTGTLTATCTFNGIIYL